MRHLLVLAVSSASLALGAPPVAQAAPGTAPGRVLLGAATARPERDVDAEGARVVVATPDGGAVLASGRSTVTLRAIGPTGAPVPGFGTAGVARVAMPGAAGVDQLLRRPDGRLLLIGSPGAGDPRRVVAAVTAQGEPDLSFGRDGIARTSVRTACVNCTSAALQPDGSILLAGRTPISSAPQGHPGPALTTGSVARLTPTGTPDPAFGAAGVATIPGTAAYAVGQVAGGRILVLGSAIDGSSFVVGLSADGADDPGYAGGRPVPVPVPFALEALFDRSGRVDVAGSTGVTRLTPLGTPEAGFGLHGTAAFPEVPGGFSPQLLPLADRGLLVASRTSYDPGRLATTPALRIRRLSATGALVATSDVSGGFGGGLASFAASATRLRPGLEQDGFAPGRLAQRPAGSFVLAGAVRVIRYTGEGTGFSAAYDAAVSLTADGQPDTSFGGDRSLAQLAVSVPTQRAGRDVRLARVLVRMRASGPGLVLLRIRDGRRRILAQSIEPLYAAGATTARVPLTATGRRVLRAGGHRVLVGHDFRDLLGARDRGSLDTRLR